MRRKKKHTDESRPTAPQVKRAENRKKYDIIGILMIVGSLLLFLALVSYSRADESNADISVLQFLKLFGGDPEIKARADVTANWLGLFGALIARFFIHSTIGYFSLVFPLLAGVWGWVILRSRDPRIVAYYTNYILLIALLLSTLFGLLRLISWFPHPASEWCGNIGDFTAGILAGFLGTIGGTALIFTAVLILAVVVIDYDIHKTIDRLGAGMRWIRGLFGSARRAPEAGAEKPASSESLGDIIDEILPPESERRSAEPAARNLRNHKSAAPAPAAPPGERVTRVTIAKSGAGETAGRAGADAPLRSDGVIPLSALKEPEGEAPRVQLSTPEPIGSQEPSDADADKETVGEAEPPPSRGLRHAAASGDVNLRLSGEEFSYQPPGPDLLHVPVEIDTVSDEELKGKAELVKDKLAMFDIAIENISVTPGPVVTLYELVPDSGVKISKIVSLEDDLALALAAKGIRIIAPIPGKSAVGIEIPNDKASMVNIRSVLGSPKFKESKFHLPIALGKTITGEIYCDDLARMPHLLVAGSTGSGKSVGINTMLASLLYRMHPGEVKFVLIDPKKIELAQYRPLRNHFLAVCPDISEEIVTTPANAVIALRSLEIEMENRYDRLAKAGVRHITDYNAKVAARALKDTETITHYRLPYIIVVIDELADLMITAAREVEEPIARIAQLARAVGIHLVLATQRPSVDVITGVIKANFSARIAYQVATRVDSRTILDMNGAEQLLGNGDMLYQPSGSPKPVRIQNAFISTEEVERVVAHIAAQKGFTQPYRLPSVVERKSAGGGSDAEGRDELFEEAARLIVRHQQGSVSLLQRRLKVGYSRAARIVDELEMAGIVGPYDGSKAREVLIESEEELNDILGSV